MRQGDFFRPLFFFEKALNKVKANGQHLKVK